MSCECDNRYKRTLYGEIKLWTGMQSGIGGGTGMVLPTVEVTVCDNCGVAEFKCRIKNRSDAPRVRQWDVCNRFRSTIRRKPRKYWVFT
jgi:hypothetical protein